MTLSHSWSCLLLSHHFPVRLSASPLHLSSSSTLPHAGLVFHTALLLAAPVLVPTIHCYQLFSCQIIHLTSSFVLLFNSSSCWTSFLPSSASRHIHSCVKWSWASLWIFSMVASIPSQLAWPSMCWVSLICSSSFRCCWTWVLCHSHQCMSGSHMLQQDLLQFLPGPLLVALAALSELFPIAISSCSCFAHVQFFVFPLATEAMCQILTMSSEILWTVCILWISSFWLYTVLHSVSE